MATVFQERKGRRGWLIVGRAALAILLVATVAAALVARDALKSRATTPPPLPVPNAYDEIARAGESILGEPPNQGRMRGAKLDDLKAWVGRNSEPLRVARAAIGRPCRVPVDYSQGGAGLGKMIGSCRMVGRLLLADAEIGLLEGRRADAAGSFVETLRLSAAISRGGLLIDALSGIAVESLAVQGLAQLVDDLPQGELRKIIPILLRHDADREPWPVVRNGEDYWVERVYSPWVRLMFRVSGVGEKMRAPADLSARQAIRRAEVTIRSLAVRMAERLYEVDTGLEPDDLSELVPDYLPAVPENPETGRPIGAAP